MVVQQRTARVERPLTYGVPAGVTLGIGDVVRVPLGPQALYGYVVGGPRSERPRAGLRALAPVAGDRVFDASLLALARWLADRYCCSLGEALGTVAFAAAVPRVVDRLAVVAPPDPARFPTLPPRLLRLIAGEFPDGFALQALLHHPEARRAGDRAALLGAVGTLVRAGVLRRERRFVAPSVGEARERVLAPGSAPVSGDRARALAAAVAGAGTLRRSEALLAGFSSAVIARAVRAGALREWERAVVVERSGAPPAEPELVATAEQRAAIGAIVAAVERDRFAEVLVQGVTGSGKTFVYIRAIARVLARGGRALVLVPEIALTPQTARRFEAAFGARVAVLHSGLSERERWESWRAATRGTVDVLVGARSAVFAPLPDLRLIVVDEAHERTYKQDAEPRYHALAVARERMRLANGTLVAGSATPPLEAYAAARTGTIAHVRLATRATAQPLPPVAVVDLAREFEGGNRRIFGVRLVEALGERLARGEKSVLFVNRRGSGSFVLCRRCGAVPRCARCSLSLVAHGEEGLLRCHLCDAQRPLPVRCPACGDGPVRTFGVGTQRVAELVAELFPQARIVRMDSDTTTRLGAHARLLDAFASDGDVLVGTQMIAKGLDVGAVTLVGVVAADIGLHAPDFRAAERTFSLITQVAGRSGRARPGTAIVQTYAPEHPAIVHAARHDYDGFAAGELEARRALGYPPFGELAYLTLSSLDRAAAAAAAARYGELVARATETEVLGPAPAPVFRVADRWRYRLALKTRDGTPLRRYLRETLRPLAARDRHVALQIDVEP